MKGGTIVGITPLHRVVGVVCTTFRRKKQVLSIVHAITASIVQLIASAIDRVAVTTTIIVITFNGISVTMSEEVTIEITRGTGTASELHLHVFLLLRRQR